VGMVFDDVGMVFDEAEGGGPEGEDTEYLGGTPGEAEERLGGGDEEGAGL